jgi:hypothetical protein
MTREDIIRMAREAGCLEPAIPDWVIRTCVLVASAEREACAGIGDDHPSWSSRMYSATIRARGQA